MVRHSFVAMDRSRSNRDLCLAMATNAAARAEQEGRIKLSFPAESDVNFRLLSAKCSLHLSLPIGVSSSSSGDACGNLPLRIPGRAESCPHNIEGLLLSK